MRPGERQQTEGEGAIYRSRDGATYSAATPDGMWLPGIYASQAAAWKALEIAETDHWGALVKAVHYSARGEGDDYRPVTVEDLEALIAGDDGCEGGPA